MRYFFIIVTVFLFFVTPSFAQSNSIYSQHISQIVNKDSVTKILITTFQDMSIAAQNEKSEEFYKSLSSSMKQKYSAEKILSILQSMKDSKLDLTLINEKNLFVQNMYVNEKSVELKGYADIQPRAITFHFTYVKEGVSWTINKFKINLKK